MKLDRYRDLKLLSNIISFYAIMFFETNGMYHVYNQGNNRQIIFFNRENYFYFLRKIRIHILPFADVLAYCLMPNHFHLMIYVNETELPIERMNSAGASPGATLSRTRTNQTLNSSIGVMLASYTRGINIQQKRSGSLFREETKAICLNESKGLAPSWFISAGVTLLNVEIPEFQYPQVCFNYIQNNPVKAGLVRKPEDWEFCSYDEIHNILPGSLVNLQKVQELGLVPG
jgi:putative transposase